MIRRISTIGLIIAIIIAYSTENQALTGKLLFVGDFEHGIIPLTMENAQSPWYESGNAPVVVTAPEPVRYGKYAMKSDLIRATSPVSYRTEVVPRLEDTQKPRFGEDYWYGFSIYFPDEWVEDNIWEIVAQWHGVPDKELGEDYRNPVMAFHTDGVNLRIIDRWDSQPNTQEAAKIRGTKYEGDIILWEGPILHGEWIDFVVHVKWSYGADGLTEIWRNGEQIVNRQGPNTFNDQKVPYFKMGLYKGWRDRNEPAGLVGRRIIYHDEVRFAGRDGSYRDVAPPGDRP